MPTADEALSREVERGMTREDLLRRAAALGIVVSGGAAFGPLTEAAFASDADQARRHVPTGDLGRVDRLHRRPAHRREVGHRTPDGRASTPSRTFDEKCKIVNHLAEELKAEKANQYLIRIRSGVEFHNGKTLDIDDVIYSIGRTKNPKLKLFGNAAFGAIDMKRIKKLDKRTCRLTLSRADVTLMEAFAQYFQGIVPMGYQPNAVGKGPLQYIGTGPFKVKSFTPGRESVHVKNENYWRSGQPYFDQVRIINFPSDAAKVNALLSGQIDAMTDVPFAQVPVVRRRSNLRILTSPTGAWTPLCMSVDVAPFNDVRVRRAFRLLINRPQVVRQGLSGFGRVANDIYSPFDPAYAGDEFPQRRYDPEQARSLLRAGRAGEPHRRADHEPGGHRHGRRRDDLRRRTRRPEASTSPSRTSTAARSTATSTSSGRSRPTTGGRATTCCRSATGVLKTAPFNETHWDAYPRLPEVRAALPRRRWRRSTRRSAPRSSSEMQRMEYNDGGLIIWGFKNLTDGYSAKVGGFKVDRGTLNLNKYGNGFRTIYFV